MPAAPPLLAHGRILGAAKRGGGEVAGDADVASDALADVLPATLLDLLGQKRVGNRRPGRADHVEHAVAHHPHHRVGRREPAHAHHRLGRELLQAPDVLLLERLLGKPRRVRVEVPVAHHEVPQVGQLTHQPQGLGDLLTLDPVAADQLVDADPAGDRGSAVDLLQRVLEHLAQQPHPVGDRPAVLVVAIVQPPRQEVLDAWSGRGRRTRTPGRSPHAASGATACRCQRRRSSMSSRVMRRACTGSVPCTARWPGPIGDSREYRFGAIMPPCTSSMPASDPCSCTVSTSRSCSGDVGVLPDPPLDVRGVLGGVMELDLLGAHHRPAALGLDAAHGGVAAGVKPAHAVAVRHLEEPVASRHRPDLDRLEQDVEAGLSHVSLGRSGKRSGGPLLARVDERDGGGAPGQRAVLGLGLRSRCPARPARSAPTRSRCSCPGPATTRRR